MYNLSDIKSIELTEISDSGTWNLHPYLSDLAPEPLVESIKRVGILQPPILLSKKQGFTLLCGRKRLLAYREVASSSACPCRILPEKYPIQQILEMVLTDQLCSGPLTLPEKSYFISLCIKHLDMPEVMGLFFDRLQLRKRSRTYKDLLAVSHVEPQILRNIHLGKISEKIVRDIIALSVKERLAIGELFENLPFGDNKQKRFLTMCRDYALRSGSTIASLLEEDELRAIRNHGEMNPPQKVASLLGLIQNRWAPLRTKAEEDFKAKVQQMHLPKECTIDHSPAFERDEVVLKTRFETLEKCQGFLSILKTCLTKK